MENKQTFTLIYSAQEQEEIQAIRKKYTSPQEPEDKMTLLRRLDETVGKKATTAALSVGLLGTLILGTGMSLAMTQLGESLGMSQLAAMLAGIPIGLVGILLVCLAYPVYNRRLIQERKRIAPQILKLTDELMKSPLTKE